jgi:monovalent cation:H+ antiporter-2, CPA2 family
MQMMSVMVAAASGSGSLVADLGMVLATAAIALLVFRKLGWPVLFGYITAGILLGPHLFARPLISDEHTIEQLSELGVIFLLFFIGLEFDLRRLKRVLGPALLALVIQTLTMLYLAQLIAPWLGWTPVNTLFFGSLLTISSSMVTIRVLREQGQLHSAHAQWAVGILILEDVLAVILLVILSGAALTKSFEWEAAWLITFLMGVFVIALFLIGRVIAPSLLTRLDAETEGDEALTMVSIGFVMGISVLAWRMDFSPALGAFLAGAILSQTRVTERIEHLQRSLYDLFSAVFFVTVGLRMAPQLLWDNLGWIVLVTGLVVCGKIVACWLGLFLAGQRGQVALQGSVAKAQIGEFSFIIAGLGGSLGVMNTQSMGIAFGVAFLSIFLTPLLNTHAERAAILLARACPQRLVAIGSAYQRSLEAVASLLGGNLLLRLLRRPLTQIALYFFLVNAFLICAAVISRKLGGWFDLGMYHDAAQIALWLATGVLLLPFLIAMGRNLNAITYIVSDSLFAGKRRLPSAVERFRDTLNLMVIALFALLAVLHFFSFAANALPGVPVFIALLLVLAIGAWVLWRKLIRVNSRMEWLFIESFAREVQGVEEQHRDKVLADLARESPFPLIFRELVLPDRSRLRGQRLRDLNLRAAHGVNILAIGRDQHYAFDPSPDTPLFPGDRLILLGTSERIGAAESALLAVGGDGPPGEKLQLQLVPVYLGSDCALDGQTLAGAGLRQRYGVTAIGIVRGDERIDSPGPDTMLRAGDVLYCVGQPKRLQRMREEIQA